MARVQIVVATLSGNSLRQTVHTHCASVHQAAKLVAILLRVARVTAGLAESNGSLPPSFDSCHPQADCQEPGLSPEPYASNRVRATFTFFCHFVCVLCELRPFGFVLFDFFTLVPSVLRRCWLGGRKGIRPVKN